MKRFASLYPADSMHDEVEKTISILNTGNFCQVIGLPGTGKSTLLQLLSYNDEVKKKHLGDESKSYLFIYMNFVEVSKRNIREVTKYMMISLQSALHEQGLSEEEEYIKKGLSEGAETSDELVIFRNLKTSVEEVASKGLKVVFLVDRLEHYYPYLDERFFHNLRILRNSAKYSFSVIFSLNRPVDFSLGRELVDEVHELIAGNSVFVALKHPEGLEFRLKEVEKHTGKSCVEKIKDKMIELTAGHGKLSKLSYEALLDEECKSDNLEKFLLARRAVRGALQELLDYLTPEERVLLSEGKASSFLESVGMTDSGKIAIPLFEKYMRSAHPTLRLSYNSEKGQIIRGGLDITNRFSSSEFKLLSALFERRGEVVSRDELIDAVWGELASQEGVTPQAFDQLIYRIRGKIELDPKESKILLTTKGRGYRIV